MKISGLKVTCKPSFGHASNAPIAICTSGSGNLNGSDAGQDAGSGDGEQKNQYGKDNFHRSISWGYNGVSSEIVDDAAAWRFTRRR